MSATNAGSGIAGPTHVIVYDPSAAEAERLARLVQAHPRAAELQVHPASCATELEQLADEGVVAGIILVNCLAPQGTPGGIWLVKESESGRGPLYPVRSAITQVVYTSVRLECALDVYETDHAYFLLKPVAHDRLRAALDRCLATLDASTESMVTVKSGRRNHLIAPSHVSYVESKGRKLTIHTDSGSIECYSSLTDMHAKLPTTFLRCHQSFVVNMARVETFRNREITLHDGMVIPVSRRMEPNVQEQLLAYRRAAV